MSAPLRCHLFISLKFREHLQERMKHVMTIRCPTLILWGKQDKWIPIEYAHRLQPLIYNSQLIEYDNLGHIPQEENPSLTVADTIAFLKKLNK